MDTPRRTAQRSRPTRSPPRSLTVETPGEGFTEITRDVAAFLRKADAGDGVLLAYIRHTSASLVIQENADPDVQTDLVDGARPARARERRMGARHRRAGRYAGAHQGDAQRRLAACAGVGGKLALGTWQGIYLAEHRARPHRREVLLQFIGSRRAER